MTSWVRGFRDWQTRLSLGFDRLLPVALQTSGKSDFWQSMLPNYLRRGITIYDVGGGKNPALSRHIRSELELEYVGLDADADELAKAPDMAYDREIVADISDYRGRGDADLVICSTLLEHVRDAASAICSIASVLKPGGHAVIFVPCRNALFARINLALPSSAKTLFLRMVFDENRRTLVGFPAYYDRCTPRDFRRLGNAAGLQVVEERLYYQSGYTEIFAPLHVLYRLWVLLARALWREQAAETFAVAFRMPPPNGA